MKDIATRRPEIDTAITRAKLCNDLVGGTPAMQLGGWIKKGSAETTPDYESRVQGAYLYNGYKRTRGYLTGQVFSHPVGISEESEYADLFARMADDIDLQGNNMRTFSQDFFQKGLDEGVRFLLAQYPKIIEDGGGSYWDETNGEWVKRTAQTDIDNGWRPYFIQFGYDQLLGWRYEFINGIKTLTQLRVKNMVTTEQGETDIGDKTVEEVTLLERGKWSTWRKASDKANADDWVLYEEGLSSIDEIPLSIWMPGELITDMTAVPALEDLAYLNVRHWTATADQNVLMAFVRRPPWFGKMLVNDGETVVFGPGRMVHSTSETASLQSVGVEPQSVEAGRNELKDLEGRMSVYGLMMLTPQSNTSGNKTATEATRETTENISQLKAWALSFADCFDQGLKFAAMYENMETDGEPETIVNTDFQPGLGLEPAMIIQAVDRGLIPKQMAIEEFQRRGLISDKNDWKNIQAMIANEARLEPGPTGAGLTGLADRLLGGK